MLQTLPATLSGLQSAVGEMTAHSHQLADRVGRAHTALQGEITTVLESHAEQLTAAIQRPRAYQIVESAAQA